MYIESPAAKAAAAPVNVNAEQSLLGAILISNEAFHRVSDFLTAQHFHEPSHQKIFEVCATLIREGRRATYLTVAEFLADVKVPGDKLDDYIRTLMVEATTIINAAEYGRMIYDAAVRRQVNQIMNDAIDGVKNPRPDSKIEEQIEELRSNLAHIQRPTKDTLSAVSAADLVGRPAPDRRYVIEQVAPDCTVSMFSGDGGTGKSLIALQAAAAVVSGAPFLGLATTRGPVLYFSAEDDADEMHRRVNAIASDAGLDAQDIADLHLIDRAGRDAVLATFDAEGMISPLPLWQKLRDQVKAIRPKLLILDTLADIFGGNEIDRRQARAFIQLLRGLAIEFELGVLILAHPSLNGMATKTGTSGSTGWSNSVRSRFYLERPAVDNDEADPDVRVLTNKKSNYGRIGTQIKVRWQDGVFRRDDDARLHRPEVNDLAERKFMELLHLVTKQGRDVSDKASSSFAPSLFEQHPEADGIRKRAFKRAMESLLARTEIKVEEFGPPSRRRSRIVAAS